MVQEMLPAPVVDLSAGPIGESAYDATKANNASAPKMDAEEDQWESVSLYEEILDEVEAFEYSADGESSCRKLRAKS
jgi:NAD-dependent histone deacetylase SIR2